MVKRFIWWTINIAFAIAFFALVYSVVDGLARIPQ